MNFKEVQELVKLINKSDLSEFKLKDGEFEISIRTKFYEKAKHLSSASSGQQPLVAVPSMQQAFPPATNAAPEDTADKPTGDFAQSKEGEGKKDDADSNYLAVKSPIVGTFYRSQSPEKDAYVKVGDVIEKGSVVCIVEAMKLFNEIESDIAGKIVKVMVEDAQPVEYDQVLFMVDPNG